MKTIKGLFNNLNDYKSKEKVVQHLSIADTPKEIDEHFNGSGLEFDLISTLTQFHDEDIMDIYEDAIYNDSELYEMPFYRLKNRTFLNRYVKENY